jgi:hypothetical protein
MLKYSPPPFHIKKKNEDPQNDKKKIKDPQTLKKQKIPQSSQNEPFLKTNITIQTDGRNYHKEDKREGQNEIQKPHP